MSAAHPGPPKPAGSTRRSRRRAAPGRRPSRKSRLASPADTRSLPDDALEPPELDAITHPEDLLVATGPSAVAVPVVTPRVEHEESTHGEELVPPSRVQPSRPPNAYALRAGESVVRANAAGVVIRRSRNR
ncbi:MAG: hypothetical protein ACRENE_09495 [Polyangiaceae bacterium]